MQIQQLIYFLEVANSGSINKAAEKLYATQPNLSKAISNLESELKVRVFKRTNKGVELTESGRKLYQYAATILDQMALIEGLADKEPPKVLSIASYPVITMGRLVSQFYNDHREEGLLINLVEGRLQPVLDMVESRQAELGMVMCNHVQMMDLNKTLNYKSLKMEILGTDTWYCNIGPNHPLYNRREVTIREMAQYPFVRLADDYFANLTYHMSIDGVSLMEFRKKIYVSDSSAIINFLQNTDAVRFGPKLSAADFERCGIRTIPIHNCDVQITVGWIQRKREILSPEAESFVREQLQKIQF